MTVKGDARFKGELTRDLKNNTNNLVNFHASSWYSENLHFAELLLSKAYKDLGENVQKSYAKFEEKLTLGSKMTWGIWWILARAVESLKVCTAGYFCKKYVMLELKKYRGVMSYGFLSFWFQKWHKEFGEFSYN